MFNMNETLTPGREPKPLSLKKRVQDWITNLFFSQGSGARLTHEELQILEASGADGIQKLQALVRKREEKEGINNHG